MKQQNILKSMKEKNSKKFILRTKARRRHHIVMCTKTFVRFVRSYFFYCYYTMLYKRNDGSTAFKQWIVLNSCIWAIMQVVINYALIIFNLDKQFISKTNFPYLFPGQAIMNQESYLGQSTSKCATQGRR